MNNIKASFTAGVTALTVNGLHQWDYGRALEVHASDLPAVVEMHFACPGMDEAEVRVCSVANGGLSAVIPDRCLEQSAPITVWVFAIEGTAGATVKTITLPVIARAKPQPGATVPAEHYDKYTELITQVNATIGKLTSGEVKVASAFSADKATGDSSGASLRDSYLHVGGAGCPVYSGTPGSLSFRYKAAARGGQVFLVMWKGSNTGTLSFGPIWVDSVEGVISSTATASNGSRYGVVIASETYADPVDGWITDGWVRVYKYTDTGAEDVYSGTVKVISLTAGYTA